MARPQWQRVAEQVAGDLRDRILSGELADGDLLPKEEELRRVYPVSKPSLREAMRILEAEGLVTVRRGNMGGSLVHRPGAANVAYTLAMVLRSRDVGVPDVAQALRELEPTCAAFCAARTDRRRAVVPSLRAIHRRSLASIDDIQASTRASRQFHEALVHLCGNESLIVIVGALEAIWSRHEIANVSADSDLSIAERRAALDAHGEVIELIHAGDTAGVRTALTGHLEAVQSLPAPDYGAGQVVPLLFRN
jgi:DNA-binding FadR family transcriptional regulator